MLSFFLLKPNQRNHYSMFPENPQFIAGELTAFFTILFKAPNVL